MPLPSEVNYLPRLFERKHEAEILDLNIFNCSETISAQMSFGVITAEKLNVLSVSRYLSNFFASLC